MTIYIILGTIYLIGGAVVYGYFTISDPYMDDADFTIGLLLWPVWLVLSIAALIMSLPWKIGKWIAEKVEARWWRRHG